MGTLSTVVSGREAAVDCFDLSPSVLWKAADNEVSRGSLASSCPAQAGRCTVGYVSGPRWRVGSVGRGGGRRKSCERISVLLPLRVPTAGLSFTFIGPLG